MSKVIKFLYFDAFMDEKKYEASTAKNARKLLQKNGKEHYKP
jgi:hypothetical protein